MKRVVSLWLPSFGTDRLRLQQRPPRRPESSSVASAATATSARSPLVTVTAAHGGVRVVSVDHAASAAGIAPGLTLAESHALCPGLTTAEADPAADRKALNTLADWCGRYTPWTAVDESGGWAGSLGGGAGLWLNISGCAHLFGGEAALLEDLIERLRRFGLAATAAVADTPGSAWAVARFSAETAEIVPPGQQKTALAPLPIAGLRVPPPVIEGLGQVGLRRIGDLLEMPREPLTARFGALLLSRLDQALGRKDEPLSPRLPVPAMAARLAFAEPIARAEDIAGATRHLLVDLCARLTAARQGGRRLELALYRSDGSVARIAIGTSRPARDPDHLMRLFRDKLDGVDAGFGIEIAVLAATVVAPVAPIQMALGADRAARSESLSRLIDRLGNRLKPANVTRLVECASHQPERSQRSVTALADPPASAPSPATADERSRQSRPLSLLPVPEPIEVIAPVPDGPPVLFRRGRRPYRVAMAEGPERIGPEWWLENDGHDPERQSRIRDYYRIEDSDGRRFWVYREGLYRPGVPPRWYLHGLFA
ncbi:MAG: DNA polymerase Y family protein [Xanthobacteraceae bacterium]|nr:DNA polymerase Y family protein [Xanthobacteraceae bacterium]